MLLALSLLLAQNCAQPACVQPTNLYLVLYVRGIVAGSWKFPAEDPFERCLMLRKQEQAEVDRSGLDKEGNGLKGFVYKCEWHDTRPD